MNGLHHLRARILFKKGLEPFPARNMWKKSLDYVMYGVGFIAPVALVPQILQLYTSKSSVGLSLSTWCLLIFFNFLWSFYGVVHKDMHIFFASFLMLIFDAVIVVGILLY